MSVLWTSFLLFSLAFSAFRGNLDELGAAALAGAPAAAQFVLGAGCLICLWSGALEIARRAGLTGALSRLLRPVLSRLFPVSAQDRRIMEALAANVSANLLGLGNAATPMGIRAARAMADAAPGGTASDELCMLVVLNTASVQLLPVTAASLRASAGSASPFDIIPAVLCASFCSVCAGIIAAKLIAALRR